MGKFYMEQSIQELNKQNLLKIAFKKFEGGMVCFIFEYFVPYVEGCLKFGNISHTSKN